MSRSRAEAIYDFWAKVDYLGPVPGEHPELGRCWVWTGAGARSGDGYGRFRWNGQHECATHVALEIDGRRLRPGEVACHRCDNPPCVRPSHLFGGTHKDNSDDMVAKGHQIRGDRHYARLHPERLARGYRHPRPNARINWELAREARRRLAAGESQRSVALFLAIDKSQVSRIGNGKAWAEPSE